jgi:hypothetical protein
MSQVEHKKALTVEELIEILQGFPGDSIVWVEGCDCVGKAAYVAVETSDLFGGANGVVICREDGTVNRQ